MILLVDYHLPRSTLLAATKEFFNSLSSSLDPRAPRTLRPRGRPSATATDPLSTPVVLALPLLERRVVPLRLAISTVRQHLGRAIYEVPVAPDTRPAAILLDLRDRLRRARLRPLVPLLRLLREEHLGARLVFRIGFSDPDPRQQLRLRRRRLGRGRGGGLGFIRSACFEDLERSLGFIRSACFEDLEPSLGFIRSARFRRRRRHADVLQLSLEHRSVLDRGLEPAIGQRHEGAQRREKLPMVLRLVPRECLTRRADVHGFALRRVGTVGRLPRLMFERARFQRRDLAGQMPPHRLLDRLAVRLAGSRLEPSESPPELPLGPLLLGLGQAQHVQHLDPRGPVLVAQRQIAVADLVDQVVVEDLRGALAKAFQRLHPFGGFPPAAQVERLEKGLEAADQEPAARAVLTQLCRGGAGVFGEEVDEAGMLGEASGVERERSVPHRLADAGVVGPVGAAEEPVGAGELVDQADRGDALGVPVVEVTLAEQFVVARVLAGEEELLGAETVLEPAERGAASAFGGGRTVGACAVLAAGFLLGWGGGFLVVGIDGHGSTLEG